MPRRRLGFLLGYGLFLAVAVPLGVEGLVRLLHLAPPLNRQYPGMVPDPHLPYRPKPGSVWVAPAASGEFAFETRHSSWGIRDVEHPTVKPAGVFRILGLGDSFTYGTGAAFEDTYLVRLEALLAARPGPHPRVEVVKAGMPRFFPEPERLLLEHGGLQVAPDLVVVGFTPNDVSDTAFGLDAVTPSADGFLMTREARELGGLGQWLFLHSDAARLVLGRWVQHRLRAAHPEPWDDIYRAGGAHEKDWLEVEAEYLRMRDLTRSCGARLVVLHIPERGPWGEGSSYPARRLAAWAAANGVTFVDAEPALERAAEAGEKLYWDVDPHCTAAGYRVIAETLAAGLEEQGLVP